MRAFVFAKPRSEPALLEVATPQPDEGQVLIAVRYAGFNFADVLGARGEPGYAPGWPFTPGLEVVGQIAAVGRGVAGFETGQTVVALTPDGGGYAEFALASAALTVPVPPNVSLAAAAAVPLTVATASLLVRAGDVGPGLRVLVHSASGALAAIIAVLARRAGAERLIGIVGRPESTGAAKAAGYDDVFVREVGWPDRVMEVTDGRGADAAFDPIGGPSIHETLRATAAGGRMVSYGNASGESDVSVSVAQLRLACVSIGGHSTLATARARPASVAAEMETGLEVLADGTLPLTPEVRALSEAVAVHETVASHLSTGKVAFDVSQ